MYVTVIENRKQMPDPKMVKEKKKHIPACAFKQVHALDKFLD
jgi:hypothetical protein